jgi:hypothetical protein
VASEVGRPRTISTSFMTGTGFMKCMPITLSGAPRGRGQLGDRDRRGVRGQDRLGPGDRAQALEQLDLQGLALGRGLDHDVAIGQVAVAGAGAQPGPGRVAGLAGQLALLDQAVEGLAELADRGGRPARR